MYKILFFWNIIIVEKLLRNLCNRKYNYGTYTRHVTIHIRTLTRVFMVIQKHKY